MKNFDKQRQCCWHFFIRKILMNYTKPRTPTKEQLAAIERRYEVKDGKLIVKSRDKTRMPKVGSLAGTINTQGPLSVAVFGDKFRCHHIVYFLTNGTWPKEAVYHINGNKQNNSIDNIAMIGTKPPQDADAGMVVNL
jgi:hypothetical protein